MIPFTVPLPNTLSYILSVPPRELLIEPVQRVRDIKSKEQILYLTT